MGLDFTFLGTGCPVAIPGRRGPAHLLRSAETAVLIDCGSGVAQQLVAAGQSIAGIAALIVTHYHSDHLVDFYSLVQSAWYQGRRTPWRVIAPQPVLDHIAAQMAAWQDERALRIAYEKRPAGAAAFDLDLQELRAGEGLSIGGLSITPVLVDHAPVEPAFGLHVSDGKQTLVFSGDTAPCEALADAADGVDLLVHEVFLHHEMQPIEGVRSQTTIDAVTRYHTRPEDVAAIAAKAQVGCLALTHFVPPLFDKQALLSAIAPIYAGPVVIGEDLMRIDVTARRVSHAGMMLDLGERR
ncbi:MAG: MBL fold metallo-hydrolase [Pseudomonadota bacterium]